MAAIIKCDCCDAIVPYDKAMHVRFYKMTSATTYNAKKTEEVADMCNTCYKKFKKLLKMEVVIDAD